MARIERRGRVVAAPCHSRRHAGDLDSPSVAPGLRICTGCRDLVENRLVELPELFETCAYMLDSHPNRLRERVSGHWPHGIVLRDAVVSARSEILGVLASWCGLVVAERGVTGPNELDIRRLTAFLAVHLHWLCEHPAAPDLVDELTDLSRTVTEALRPSSGFRVAAGRCPRPGCGLPVHAEIRRDGEEPYAVSCEAGHEWAAEHWLTLWGRQRGEGGDLGHAPSPSASPSPEAAE